MAITVQSSPGSFASANKGLYHVVTSTNSTQTNFKYVFDIQVGGTTIATIKNFADSGGYGILDASEIIRQYFTTGFTPGNTGVLQNTNNFINIAYTINYGEEYGGVTYTNLTSASYTAWNFALDPFQTSLSNYQNKFITNRDKSLCECGFGESFFVTYLNSANANVKLTIQKLLLNGATDGSAVTTSALSTASVILFNLGGGFINTTLGSNFITSSTYAYQVTIGTDVIAYDSIIINNVCNTRFQPVNIVFLNQNGGYESFAFRLASRQINNIENFNYGLVEYQRSGGNMINSSNNVIIGGKRSFGTNTKLSYNCVSDYMNATDYKLGGEMLTSPETYALINGVYYPIIFKQTTWTEKIQTADRVFNYELEFELGITQKSQIR